MKEVFAAVTRRSAALVTSLCVALAPLALPTEASAKTKPHSQHAGAHKTKVKKAAAPKKGAKKKQGSKKKSAKNGAKKKSRTKA